ncbi:MAG TPA: PAS domain S-box protein, partial [Verrucomicrobiae bacterium]|nr:PAS domain S-box protein [Verrucomicrobiae bacterium]
IELAASEARLKALVEHAPEAIVVFDGESGRFLFGNHHTCRLYGVQPEELTRLSPEQVSPEFQAGNRRSAELAREKMDEALAGGTPVFDWIHRHTSGRLVPTEVRLVRLPDDHGRPLLRASIIDNTERKRREAIQQAVFQISEAAHGGGKLAAFYERVHAIVQGLMPAKNFYIALLQRESASVSFPYFVDEYEPAPQFFPLGTGLTGYVLRTGKPLLVGPELIAQKRRMGNEVTYEGLPELRYVESGKPAAIWLGVPLNLGGVTLGVMAVQDYHSADAYGQEDIRILTFVAEQTALALERKQSEQALRESEEKFRALFAASSQGVMLHDDQQYLEVNPAAVRMLGYASERDFLGKHPVDTSPPFQPNGERSDVVAARYIRQCLDQGSARFEWVGRTAQGRDIPLEVNLTRIQWSGRQVIQAFITDISQRKQAEAELLNTLAREKELGQLKSNFVSMVSHEFRTPLGIIQSSAEILRDYFERLKPEERQEQLQSIVKNTRRMAEMMEEVLVLSRLDAGKMEFKPAPMDLAGFCRRVVEEVLSATDRRCPIELSLAGVDRDLLGDERLLSHILTNLLSNAAKYSNPGSPVRFKVQSEGGEVVFSIRDEGIGIPAGDRKWLFTAFHRGSNVGDRPGTGLGLVLVKRCVELHGGQMQLESQAGLGTAAIVRLPLMAPTP